MKYIHIPLQITWLWHVSWFYVVELQIFDSWYISLKCDGLGLMNTWFKYYAQWSWMFTNLIKGSAVLGKQAMANHILTLFSTTPPIPKQINKPKKIPKITNLFHITASRNWKWYGKNWRFKAKIAYLWVNAWTNKTR